MKRFTFKTSGDATILASPQPGFHAYKVGTDKFGRPSALAFRRADGSGLEISSFVYELGPRLEVGSLSLKTLSGGVDDNGFSELPKEFHRRVQFTILTAAIEDSEVESGLVIKGGQGEEIMILPGEMPYSLHILSSFFADPFGPEFDLAAYRRSGRSPEPRFARSPARRAHPGSH